MTAPQNVSQFFYYNYWFYKNKLIIHTEKGKCNSVKLPHVKAAKFSSNWRESTLLSMMILLSLLNMRIFRHHIYEVKRLEGRCHSDVNGRLGSPCFASHGLQTQKESTSTPYIAKYSSNLSSWNSCYTFASSSGFSSILAVTSGAFPPWKRPLWRSKKASKCPTISSLLSIVSSSVYLTSSSGSSRTNSSLFKLVKRSSWAYPGSRPLDGNGVLYVQPPGWSHATRSVPLSFWLL